MKNIAKNVQLFFTGAVSGPPDRLVLEATNHCNRSCFFCGAAQEMSNVQRGFMEWSLFLRLADQAKEISPAIVSLHAHGEPLLHPQIVEMVAELKKRELVTEIVTNGDLLTFELSQKLLHAGLDQLIISHPAISRENWQSCRTEPHSKEIDTKLGEALDVWQGAGKTVTIRCLVFKEYVPRKVASVREYLHTWLSKVAVSGVEFWLYQPWPGHVLEDQIPHIHKHAKICWPAMGNLSVSWKGEVSPCPYDVTGELVFKNQPAATLGEMYSSQEMRRFRRQTIRKAKSRHSLCKKCLINRVPAQFTSVDGREYQGLSGQPQEEWLKQKGRECWLQLIQKSPGK